MSKKHALIAFCVLILALGGCGPTPLPTKTPLATTEPPAPTATAVAEPTVEPTPEQEPTSTPSVIQKGLLISELLPGILGVNNNLEFVELYNAGIEPLDLDGWSVWYRADDEREETLLYAWEGRADVPGAGHYLLVRAGQDVGNIGDAEFEVALFERKGGVALRDPDGETVDALVWGEGPASYITGLSAPAPEGGASLERLPGGEDGNATHSGDNAADFVLNPAPNPQNSGDPITPLPEDRLAIRLEIPETVIPGSEVQYTVEIENLGGNAVHEVHAVLPIPTQFEVVSTPEGGTEANGWLEWVVPELAAGATEQDAFVLHSPWTYLEATIKGYYVEASDAELRVYGPLRSVAVGGGTIPIGTARTLKGLTVSVEGVATMYTDGYYAGADGTKFYMEDETGGIQVYCPGAMGIVEVSVGDRVRVTGLIDVYRASMEIIPATYPDDVEVLEQGGSQPEPAQTTVQAAGTDESVLGRLIVVEGTATRIEEFTYSYEVDLMDDQANTLLVYVDKETGVTTEPMDIGKRYRVTGISEVYDTTWQIKPRFRTDLVEVFPPELMLELYARNSVLPGETVTYTLIAYNHTDAPLTNVQIVAPLPAEGVSLAEVQDGGQQDGAAIVWTLAQLAGNGGSAAFRYLVTVDDDASGQILAEAAVASADQWPSPVETAPMLTFVGSGVPIWAIQGAGMASPYVRNEATTEGVVIGVFPELEGFWIQEPETDDDPATSAGLFVLSGELEVPAQLGDHVRVSGKVRELSGQTTLQVFDLDDVTVVSTGNELPDAVELDPPQEDEAARVYYEALEGMLVQVSEPARAVAPTTKYGETTVVRAEQGIERVMKGDQKGMLIFVDDGSDRTHYDLGTLPFALQTSDSLSDVTGPLAFTYENYKIEPITEPTIMSTERPLPSAEPAGPDEFSVATLNVEDLFDYFAPSPSDPPMPSRIQYDLDLTKTANTILAMGAPTILGLQEVENIGILVDLVKQGAITGYDYQPFLFEGTDSRGIDVAYLVRGDQATVEGAAALAAPEGLTSRPPLLITVTVHLEGGDTTVYVLNNHFTSMSGGEKPTEPRRTAQATWNVALVERILADKPDAHVMVLGDLNSFYDSPPMDEFRLAGLRHVYEFVEPERPYSYIYQGESETLDHIWMTPGLYGHLARVEALHINADYPPPIPGDPSARRTSDHDPVIAVFAFR